MKKIDVGTLTQDETYELADECIGNLTDENLVKLFNNLSDYQRELIEDELLG